MVERFGRDIKRPVKELPGEVPLPLFKDRIKEAHQNSQIGFIMVKVPENTEPFNVDRMREVMRKIDSFCISDRGTIIILVSKLISIAALETIIGKIREKLSDIVDLKVGGLFIPFPELDFSNIEYTLEDIIKRYNQEPEVRAYKALECRDCNTAHCILRDELNYTSCIVPEFAEKKDVK